MHYRQPFSTFSLTLDTLVFNVPEDHSSLSLLRNFESSPLTFNPAHTIDVLKASCVCANDKPLVLGLYGIGKGRAVGSAMVATTLSGIHLGLDAVRPPKWMMLCRFLHLKFTFVLVPVAEQSFESILPQLTRFAELGNNPVELRDVNNHPELYDLLGRIMLTSHLVMLLHNVRETAVIRFASGEDVLANHTDRERALQLIAAN